LWRNPPLSQAEKVSINNNDGSAKHEQTDKRHKSQPHIGTFGFATNAQASPKAKPKRVNFADPQ